MSGLLSQENLVRLVFVECVFAGWGDLRALEGVLFDNFYIHYSPIFLCYLE